MLLRSCPLASLLIVVVIALSLVPAAVSDCRVAVNQTTRAAAASGRWTSGDFVFQIFDLQLSNPGDQPLSSILLDIDLSSSSSTGEDNSANSSAIAQFWNLVRLSANGSVISFSAPAAFGAIQPGASLGAGYIVRAHVPSTSTSSSSPSSSSASTFSVAEPNVTVSSTSCDGTPGGGGGGAVPTATPAVATPAPAAESGCNASATIEARTAATGSWRDGDGRAFQIYDVRTTNTGTRPITGAVVTIAGLSSGANVTQFWELGSPQQPQQGATADSTGETSTVFPIVFGYGPIQPGAWQGAGFVVATAAAAADTAAAPANLTATLSGLACA